VRIVPLLFLLLLATPAHAQEFVPPHIVVSGEWSPEVTKATVTQTYKLAKPACVKLAIELARRTGEVDDEYRRRQNTTFIFCMAEEFARDGLSVYEDVPQPLLGNS
jgi:hypothetical protein